MTERRVARQVAAQDQSVDEEPDEIFRLQLCAPGDGRADRNVGVSGVSRQEGVKRREQSREEGRALAAREHVQGGVELGRQDSFDRCAAERLDPRTGAVGRQIQHRRDSGELLLPVGDLGLEDLAPHPVLLPDCIVGVLNGQLRQRRGLSGPKRVVERGQLAEQDFDGPSIRNDVMHRDDQDMLIVREPPQLRPEQRPVGQIEVRVPFDVHQTQGLVLTGPGGDLSQVDFGKRDRGGGRDDLDGPSVAERETGAQRVVALEDFVDALLQGLDVKGSGQAQCGAQIVGGDFGLEIVKEPEPLLRKRNRERRRRSRLVGETLGSGHDGLGGRKAHSASGPGEDSSAAPTDSAEIASRDTATIETERPVCVLLRPIVPESSATVGFSKRSRSEIGTENAFWRRAKTRVARSECPPSSKKLSCTPTCSSPRTWLQIAATVRSTASRGAEGPLELRPRRVEARQRPASTCRSASSAGRRETRTRRHHELRQRLLEKSPQLRDGRGPCRPRVGHETLVPRAPAAPRRRMRGPRDVRQTDSTSPSSTR